MRLLITLLAFLTITLPAFPSSWVAENRVPFVGTIITKKNSLGNNIQFKIVNTLPDNNSAISSNIININKSDLANTIDDNEIAYILSKEIGKIIVTNINSQKKYTPYDIDAMSIDLMVNSGYNPLASISILSKNSPEDKKHAMELYNYISYNYPTKILIGYYNNEYESFLKSSEKEINERKIFKNKLNKFNKTQAQLCKKRARHLGKYNEHSSLLAKWNISAELLQSITEPEFK